MAVNIFQTGVSGIKVAQRQLSTVSHNIVNANQDGYTRQTNIQVTSPEFFEGGNYFGTGAITEDVRRSYLSFVYFDLVRSHTEQSYANKMSTSLKSIDDAMGSIGRGNVLGGLDGLFESLNAVVDAPADLGVRRVFLEKARASVVAWNTIHENISQNYLTVNDNLRELASQVTRIGSEIATLNTDIVNLSGPGRGDPNDLLDKRDLLVRDLSKLVSVKTLEDRFGALTVMIGGKSPLVIGNRAFTMGMQPGQEDPIQEDVYLQPPKSTQRVRLTGTSLGGEIGALFEYRDDILGGALDRMGLSILALADAFNTEQANGADINGNLGVNLFNDINDAEVRDRRAYPTSGNTGTLDIDVSISNVSDLRAAEFQLEFLGTGQYRITNLTDNTTAIMTTSGTAPALVTTDPNFQGFTVNLTSGAPAVGDTYLLQPSRYAGAEIGLAFEKVELLATSSLLDVNPDNNNVSPATLTIVGVSASTDPNFPTASVPLLVTALQSSGGNYFYSVFAGSTSGTVLANNLAYTPPQQDVTLAGLTFRLEGLPVGEQPNAPERYEIVYAVGPGNNINVQNMAQIQTATIVNGSQNTIYDNFELLITDVGSDANNANQLAVARDISFEQSFERYSQISGVNMNEEGAYLLQYQQAYVASTRVITTARAIFDTLLEAAR